MKILYYISKNKHTIKQKLGDLGVRSPFFNTFNMRNFRFLRNNDGTEAFPNNICDEYYQRIIELEERNTLLHNRVIEYSDRLSDASSRVYPDIINVRDEQRIDGSVSQHFTNRNDFVMHLRRQQANRIIEKLLEENLIEHTFTQDDINGDFISRMKIKVQNIL